MEPPDTKELFVYKLLYHIGIGPQVDFIIPSLGSKKTIYIVTKDCHLVLLSKLTNDTANINALLQIDLISRILCLGDCATNSSNCGQVDEKPMIVDFRIQKRPNGYAIPEIMDKFYKGNSEFQYFGLMKDAVNTCDAVKLKIVKESLQEWNLLEKIDRVEAEMREFLTVSDGKINFENDLEQYVKDLKASISVLMNY